MQIPVLLPEKLSTIRCLLEVEDSTSTDLAGDAGAVGRFGLVKEDSHQRAQLDLKGNGLYAVGLLEDDVQLYCCKPMDNKQPIW